MSCQQASRFITTTSNNNNSNIVINNNNNSSGVGGSNHISNSSNSISNLHRIVSAEDPYVFTESVPTTPPILFNTQKSRPRLNDISGGAATISFGNGHQQQQQQQHQHQQPRVALTNGKIAAINTQAPLATTTPTLKNVTAHSLATTAAATQNKKAANVCIVRPQLQQQQHQQHQQHHVISSSNPNLERELKSISPPPLYTPTPSLWQTPLLIETAPAIPTPASSPSPAAAVTPLPSTPTLVATLGANVSAPQPLASNGSPSTATAMAKVAPIVVHAAPPPPPASCLPPSKFHNHTLAQHLQKVECLKKPKKVVQPIGAAAPLSSPIIASEDFEKPEINANSCMEEQLDEGLQAKAVKHSANEELNEIPVNVIFRMALVPQQQQQQQNEIKNKKVNNGKFLTPAAINHHNNSATSSTTIHQAKSNVQRKMAVTTTTTPTPPASRINQVARTQQQICTSSKQQQEQQCNSTQHTIPAKQQTTSIDDIENAPLPLTKSKGSSAKSRKSATTKSNVSTSNHCDASDTFTIGCSTSKGAVAIVKMSHRRTEASELDTSHLATPTGLPYCVQNYWFNSYDFRSRPATGEIVALNGTGIREERIALYKQQLRRQAMQLLSTRSLQKLPMQMSRRRLLCVDRLIRKYQKQNEKGLPVNVKRCCVNGCDAYTLEMASHCQQHIALNAGQTIFLPCTAKFADNTQCRVPVFDITHDLPLCLEHARKRDAYNRLLYEQRPRKISTPTGITTSSMYVGETIGKVIKSKQPIGVSGAMKRVNAALNAGQQQQQPAVRKRKTTGNPVGRPQKRVKKCAEVTVAAVNQMPRLTTAGLKRKNSTTSLESIASNSQHSTASSTSQLQHYPQFYTMTTSSSITTPSTPNTGVALPPPALAPLSTGFTTQSLPQHLFSFGHDGGNFNANVNKHSTTTNNNNTLSPTTELKDFISNLTFSSHMIPSSCSSSISATAQATTIESGDAHFINTNSNSNFTSSGMGSTTSLPTADDFLTQDMLSICENSSVSSVDTGLGGLSDPELMLGGPDGDDIPLGDTHLLEEHDLANVLSSLPDDAFKELFSTVHQDESDEIERAIELADKHLKTLQQTIGSELGDFLDFNDDMLMDNSDICNSASTNHMIDTSAIFLGPATAAVSTANINGSGGGVGGGVTLGANPADIRGLVQT